MITRHQRGSPGGGPLRIAARRAIRIAACSLPLILSPSSALGQASAKRRVEDVDYRNVDDGTVLAARLVMPAGAGPHPGIVVLSVAGTGPLVDRLVADGYAVLTPERRGFVDVEPLLRATYADLSGDALAALDYLRSRGDLDRRALMLVAQGDDAPPAMLAVSASEHPVPLVLLAPPAFSGVETFRLEQRAAARRDRAGPDEIEALGRYVDRIADIVLGEREAYVRAYRLENLRAGSPVQLPRSAAFPSDERQMHFFASPLWHDRLAFEPEEVLARLRSPVLVLIGADDANIPMADYLAAVRRGLGAAETRDATLCRLPGRTRHAFTEEGVEAIAEWVRGTLGPSPEASAAVARAVPGCLSDSDAGEDGRGRRPRLGSGYGRVRASGNSGARSPSFERPQGS
jgi:dienelactone hydrolase